METKARKHVRAKWKKEAGELINAHELAFSAIASALERFSGRYFEQQSESVEGRMSLSAQFLQGVDICETVVSEGLYSQAATLLKQEMETIEAIHEFQVGKRREGKTPRIGGRLPGFGPIYGDLNGIAHVSRRDLALQLVHFENAEVSAPSVIPQYNFELSKMLYGLNVFFIFDIARLNDDLFRELFGEGLNEEELSWLFGSMKILQEFGVIIPDKSIEK